MKLRWKYFIVLLVASLVPMLAVTAISQQASKSLGKSISAKTQTALMETVRREIVSATENYAFITRMAKSSYEFALHALVREAGINLNLPSRKATKIYFARDFEDSKTAPDDLAPSSVHMKILKDGSLLPKMISYNHPNFLLAPGVDRTDVGDDIAGFTRLSPALTKIVGQMKDSVYWIYVSSESGVHISYPGHGGYPAEYDPRKRPWYMRAKKRGTITWGPPIVDATTRQLTFTVSAPFKRSDGSFAGVAAIDVLIPNVLLKTLISSQWSTNMKSFLIGQSEMTVGDKKPLWMLSQEDQAYSTEHMADDPKAEVNYKGRQKDLQQLVQKFENKRSGSFEMPFQGEDSIWAFASIFSDLHFVIVAPISIVTGLSDEVGESFLSYTRGQTKISLAAVCIVIIFVAGLALFFSRMNTRNLMSIVHGFKRLGKGDFDTKLSIRFNDERDLIVTTFNQIVPRLEEHLRMSRTLDVAKEVQQNLLPKNNLKVDGLDIAGKSVYCDETGGDYYDFIIFDDAAEQKIGVAIGDVSGHGIPSALLMATVRSSLRQRASLPGSTAKIISDVNRQLVKDVEDSGQFMTMFFLKLDTIARQLEWVRAGHDPAMLYDPGSDSFTELGGSGIALGVDAEWIYENYKKSEFSNGQIIILSTDGIWEARNKKGEMLGKEPILNAIRQNASSDASQIVNAIFTILYKFIGDAKIEDDITSVVLKL